MLKQKIVPGLILLIFTALSLQSCAGWDPSENTNQQGLHYSADTISSVTISKFLEVDPAIQSFVDNAYAMAVLPKIAKAGFTVGGAYGKGRLYVNQILAGTASLKQLSYGLTFGWQKYRQLVFFKDKQALDKAMISPAEFSGQLSYALASLGAAGTTDYRKGIAVFILPISGAMAEVSIAGQQLDLELY